jgi:hypothetical protein
LSLTDPDAAASLAMLPKRSRQFYCRDRSANSLEEGRLALPNADTQRGEAIAAGAAAQLVQE